MHVHAHIYTQTDGIMHMRNLNLNFTKERQRINGRTHTHTHTHKMSYSWVLSPEQRPTYNQKENINLLTISILCTFFFRVNRNTLIYLKWQPKAPGNKSGIVETLILKDLTVLA